MHHHCGSIWAKWDLHFHTPASYDYQDKGVTNQQIVDTLITNNIRVVAITDHHTVDVAQIKELQKLGADKLTVLPGIELRSELGGSESVHFIGIFPENTNLDDIWIKLQGKLELTPADIQIRGGNDKVYFDLKQTADLIHELGGFVSIHGGNKSNSIEKISNRDLYKQALKSDLLNDYVDIIDLGQPRDEGAYQEIVFPAIKKWLPLVICTDNHRVTEYAVRAPCWIKADPCFEGLRKVIIEPQERVYIGDQPPKLELVQQQPAKFIQGIRINKAETSNLDEVWFDGVELELNHDLVAVIGNKGTGKSALADILALLGNTRNYDNFSFLKPNRFRSPGNNRAEHFEATLYWKTERSIGPFSLNRNIDQTTAETIKYIPQGLFEEICTELETGKKSRFDCELQQVIFSHVPLADRLGKDTLEDLIDYKTEQTDEAIEELKSQLVGVNEAIVKLQEQLKLEYRQRLLNQIAIKDNELADHEAQKPAEVPPPPAGELTPKTQEISEQLKAAETCKADLEAQIQISRNQEATQKVRIAVADRALQQVTNFRQQFAKFKESLEKELQQLDINFDELVTLTTNTQPVEQKRTEAQQLVDTATVQLDANQAVSLVNYLKTTQNEIRDLQDKLDEPNRRYQIYINKFRDWEKRREEIIGAADQPGSLEHFKAQLAALEQLPSQLDRAKEQRIEIVKQIYSQIKQLTDTYQQLYQSVQTFIDEHPEIQAVLQLNFAVPIVNIDLHNNFFDWVGRNVVGSFYGTTEGNKVLNNLIQRHDIDSEESMLAFLNDLIDHLTHDKRNAPEKSVAIESQLKQGKSLNKFYDYIYSLDYLRPRYMLQMAGKEISQLSPGERGALLLIFYLLIDRDQSPLIIDQPDENLDNQTVYQLLVGAIKKAKQRRQIILVTHNPNLAVVCDAEQIICCDIDKEGGNKITYTSGAIENPEINKKVVDILEGTPPAFYNRHRKYRGSVQ